MISTRSFDFEISSPRYKYKDKVYIVILCYMLSNKPEYISYCYVKALFEAIYKEHHLILT